MQIKVASNANRKVVSPNITPNDVWLSSFIDICAIIIMDYNDAKKSVNSNGTGISTSKNVVRNKKDT